MKLSEAKKRRDELIERDLQICSDLSESKRAWIQDGRSAPHGSVIELEAEQARIRLEKHRLANMLSDSKAAEKAARQMQSHQILLRLLADAGLAHYCREADRLAMDHLIQNQLPE